MNRETIKFIEELKKRPDVLGIVLFGSWARGDNRPDSDVDLVVLLKKGFRRTVEFKKKQSFEITYTTPAAALAFYKGHKDDCAGFWSCAKILYDKTGAAMRLKKQSIQLLRSGKSKMEPINKARLLWDASEQLASVKFKANRDLTSAMLHLHERVINMTEIFFDLKRLWTPAPKHRITKIKEISRNLYKLLKSFYTDDLSFDAKLKLARKMIPVVFEE